MTDGHRTQGDNLGDVTQATESLVPKTEWLHIADTVAKYLVIGFLLYGAIAMIGMVFAPHYP
jgi:hypothetical protein